MLIRLSRTALDVVVIRRKTRNQSSRLRVQSFWHFKVNQHLVGSRVCVWQPDKHGSVSQSFRPARLAMGEEIAKRDGGLGGGNPC